LAWKWSWYIFYNHKRQISISIRIYTLKFSVMQWTKEMLVHTFVTVQVTHLIWFVNDKRDLEWLNWKSIEVHIPSLISYNQLYKYFCNLLSFGQFKHFSYRVTCKKIGFLVLISITLSYQWFIKINLPVCSISRTLNSLEKNTI